MSKSCPITERALKELMVIISFSHQKLPGDGIDLNPLSFRTRERVNRLDLCSLILMAGILRVTACHTIWTASPSLDGY